MAKAITLEMLHAMTPAQRKTLHGNASAMDTPAARAVLELLTKDDLMPAPKVVKAPKVATLRKTAFRTSSTKPRAAKTATAPKAKAAPFGRQA